MGRINLMVKLSRSLRTTVADLWNRPTCCQYMMAEEIDALTALTTDKQQAMILVRLRDRLRKSSKAQYLYRLPL